MAVLLLVLALGAACMVAGNSEARDESAPTGEEANRSGEGEGNDSTDEAGEIRGDEDTGDDGDEDEEEIIPVEVDRLGLGHIEQVLRSSTNLEAESEVQVFAEAARKVRALLVEEGDRVKRNQVLLRLQDEEQRSNLAKVKSQLAKAQREYQRQQRLFAENLISEQVFNEATYELEQLEIALADAERELGYTEVRAPIGGTVTQRLVNLGDQVQVGQHLFDIVDFESLVARVYVPEKDLGRVSPGLPARITAQALGDRIYRGRVDRISPVIDPRSGTIKVTVAVGGQAGLRPGLYVDVALVTDVYESTLLVPKRALVYDGDQTFVFRLKEDETVERLAIVPLLADEVSIKPLGGVEAGDRLVVAGQASLKDGARVRLIGVASGGESEAAEPEATRASR
jgi:membrane fusion protein (multidrug efflux system)